MARLGRTFLPDRPLHVIQRGNNRGAVLFGEDDDAQYGGWLAEAADGHGCRIHAYVFMIHHVHLLATPEREDSLPRTMQSSGRDAMCATSTRRIAEPERSGRARDRAAPIDREAYFLAWSRDVELKAVRARRVRHPRDDRWSSFRARADGRAAPLAGDHQVYRALGRGAEARQSACRALFRGALENGFVNALRAASNGGWALGPARFGRQIEAAPRLPGRPRKQPRNERRQLALL